MPGRTGDARPRSREPSLGDVVVARERLLDAVLPRAGPVLSQVVVTAPAGTGKTTLLVQAAHHLRRRGEVVCWLGVQPEDADPGRLLDHLLDALHDGLRAAGDPAATRVADIAVPVDPGDRGFLAAVVDAARPRSGPTWLLVDDAHTLPTGAAGALLGSVLDVAGADLRTVLAGRWSPPVTVARRVVAGTAAELRADALAFDKDEARALLRAHGVDLPEEELLLLHARTEGWVAGLRLAVASLQQASDPRAQVAAFTGDRRPVADYLVTEVLHGLPGEDLAFLLATAAPAELPLALAVELSGRSDAGAVLERLSRAGLLTSRLPGPERTYRYHALLRGYLAAEAQARDLPSARRQHARTAAHFAAAGAPELALEHASATGDPGLITELLRTSGLPLLLRGVRMPVQRALERLPRDVGAHPWASLLGAHVALLDGSLGSAAAALADPALDRVDDAATAAYRTGLELWRSRLTGTAPFEWSAAAAAAAPDALPGPPEQVFLAAMRGMSLEHADADEAAEVALVAAQRRCIEEGFDHLALECASRLALTAGGRGDARVMLRRAADAIAFARARGWERTALLMPDYFTAAWGAWSAADVEATERYLQQAEAVLGPVEPRLRTFLGLLRAYASHDTDHAHRALARRVQEVWRESDESAIGRVGMSASCLVEVAFASSARDEGWIRQTVARAERTLAGTGDLDVVRATVELASDPTRPPATSLVPVLLGERRTTMRGLVQAWLVECLARHRAGRREQAHEALLRVLDEAAPRSLVRVLATAPDPLVDLLRRGRGRFGPHEDFVAAVLRVARDEAAAPHAHPPLTERELAILRDLPSLLSLQEIAAAHHVSENTVKTHVRSVYAKLGVHDRRSAVRRAEELGLR